MSIFSLSSPWQDVGGMWTISWRRAERSELMRYAKKISFSFFVALFICSGVIIVHEIAVSEVNS